MILVMRNYATLFLYCFLSHNQICIVEGNLGGLYDVLNHAVNNIAESVTRTPTSMPTSTISPSMIPSTSPSLPPSPYPTLLPSSQPTVFPSTSPSSHPTHHPSSSPTSSPSSSPSKYPTSSPSSNPSSHPTTTPSYHPTSGPSALPSFNPTLIPSRRPSSLPSSPPSLSPTINPTTLSPTMQPSISAVGVGAMRTNESTGTDSQHHNNSTTSTIFLAIAIFGGVAAISTIFFVSRHLVKKKTKPAQSSDLVHDGNEFDDHPMDQSFANQSTIRSESTSVWRKRIEFDTRTYADVSEFHLPSVFNGSTIKSEGSWARRCQAPLPLRHENLDEVFGSITIPNQIVCIKEVEE